MFTAGIPVCRRISASRWLPDVVTHLPRRDAALDRVEQHVQLRLERVGEVSRPRRRQREVVQRERADDLGAAAFPSTGW